MKLYASQEVEKATTVKDKETYMNNSKIIDYD